MRRLDYLFLALGCFGVCAALALFLGCSSGPSWEGTVWDEEIEQAWTDVTSCWQTPNATKPMVVIRDDCRDKYDAQDFNLGGDTWVHGTATSSVVQVCPDLKALRHEMSHVVVKQYGFPNYHGVGCWL